MSVDVKESIRKRRAYRALAPVEIDDELIHELGESIRLPPSCFNKQPWRFVFVRSPEVLKKLHSSLSMNNRWVEAASLIIAVYSWKDLDCVLPGRDYYLFDTGMATAFLILRATELGLVAHPIAGFDDKKVKAILQLPEEATVIALVIVGKHTSLISSLLTAKQAEAEVTRPARKPIEELISVR